MMTDHLSDEVVLLTGGTGSFGTAFVSHVLDRHPGVTIRIFSRDELKQLHLRERFGEERLRFLVGDVRDRNRLKRAAEGADIIIHAAAMKQVPACEYNPSEAIQTNVNGAQNVVDAGIDAGVDRILAVSTDKAVNPVNLYGATKLCAEKLMVQGNAYAGAAATRISCVRYGNVAGSRGSVVPLWRQQAATGELTVTDSRMTRFWITLPQAVDFVLIALRLMRGGEILVPRIPSVRVTDLAAAIAPQAKLRTVGIRPGEKLHELLLTAAEARHTVQLEQLYAILPQHSWWGMEGWEGATTIPENFVYASDTNDQWLTVSDLRSMLNSTQSE